MKNKKSSWLVLATIAVVFLALIIFSGRVFLQAQSVGEASVLWSTTGLSDCKLSYWDHANVQQIYNEDAPLSGNESLSGLIEELSNFTISDLVSLSNDILSEALPFHWGAQVICKDTRGNKVWLSLSAYFPQVSIEPKLITQLKDVIGWVGNLTFRKSNYQLTEAQFNWTINGLKNCTLGVLESTGNQYNGGTIPGVGKEVLTKYDINELLNVTAEQVVEAADGISHELLFNAQYKVVCQDRADNNVSLSVEVNVPKISEPRFISQLREIDQQPKENSSVDIKFNGSDGPINVDQSTNGTLTINAVNITTCMAGWRNLNNDTVLEEDVTNELPLKQNLGFAELSDVLEDTGGGSKMILYVICVTPSTSTTGEKIADQIEFIFDQNVPPVPKVDLKIMGSDDPISAQIGDLLKFSWVSSNSVSCQMSERNNSTGDISEWTVGLSGNYSKTVPNNWAGQQIAYSVLCKNTAGNFSDDTVIVNVNGRIVTPPPITPPPVVPPVPVKCGVTGGDNEFQIYYYTRSGDKCNSGFGSGYVAACYDGTLQVAFPGYNCLSRETWLKAAQSGCANHCTTGSGGLNVNSVINRLNSDFIKILQGMVNTLTLLMQRPNDPVVGNIVSTFSELSNSIRSTLNYLNQLK